MAILESFPQRPIVAVVTAIIVVGSCCTACSGSPGIDPENRYAAEIRQAMDETDSELVKEVLSDGVITDAEALAVREAAVDCIRDLGFDARLDGEGITITIPAGTSDAGSDEAHAKCTRSTTAVILPLYESIRKNPDNLDRNDLRLECLQRNGVLDESWTPDQFRSIDYSNPPWSKLSGDVWGCWDDPINYNGGQRDFLPSEVEGGDLSMTAEASPEAAR